MLRSADEEKSTGKTGKCAWTNSLKRKQKSRIYTSILQLTNKERSKKRPNSVRLALQKEWVRMKELVFV